MNSFYLDTSALVKLYFKESGSEWMKTFWLRQPTAACSPLGLVEVLSAVARRNAGANVSPKDASVALDAAEEDFQDLTATSLDDDVLRKACQIARKHRLRGADAIHLASAVSLKAEDEKQVTLIASDDELLEAATAEGLETLDPRTAPQLQ